MSHILWKPTLMMMSSKFSELHTLNLQSIKKLPCKYMKLSPVFTEIWSFETIHCLNFNMQRQKPHDLTND